MTNYQSQSQPAANSDICVAKIIEANSLEASGEIDKAIALYQEIIELDGSGNYGSVAQQALDNLEKSSTEVTTTTQEQVSGSWWQKLSLKAKTTLILIGVSSLSTIAIGSVAYYFANRSISQQIITAEETVAVEVADKVAFYMRERYGDIQIMANLAILTTPELRASTTVQDKQTALDSFIKAYGIYNSVAFFDLEGNVLAQSTGKALGNHKDRSYFQEALKKNGPVLSQPILSKSSGIIAVYLASPVKDSKTGQNIGVLRARMPVRYLQDVIGSAVGKEKNYILDNQGQIFAASDEQEFEAIQSANEPTPASSYFPVIDQLQQKAESTTVVTKQDLVSYIPFADFTDEFRSQLPNLGWSTVTTLDKQVAFKAQRDLLITFTLGTIVAAAGVAAIAALIGDRATRPILDAARAVKQLGQGELDTRVQIQGQDELADLGSNINLMAAQIQGLLQKQEAEAWKQRQEKERLQNGVMNLLLDVEGAQKGDLTVQAQMSEGAVGSIADAFNATLRQLRNLLVQVQSVSNEVGELSQTGEGSVRQLSQSAEMQAAEIDQALNSIAEINESVLDVAGFSREAAEIARQGLLQAKEGDSTMDMTVNSIEKIRTTVATTSKQVKQLAESSQEIAQIVDIISGISEKTNLLAFNASVEAARAGEHGEGFRIVAEEVRRLADRITEATKDIQQLVSTIQQDTTSVLEGMETSTAEVVNGSELVRKTKQTLQSLAGTSQKIDTYLQSISSSTIEQTNTSKRVNEKISGIATIAKENSSEAQNVVQSLRTLVEEAETLQASVSKFKLQA